MQKNIRWYFITPGPVLPNEKCFRWHWCLSPWLGDRCLPNNERGESLSFPNSPTFRQIDLNAIGGSSDKLVDEPRANWTERSQRNSFKAHIIMSPPCMLSTKKLKVAYVLYLIRDRYGIVTVFQRLELDVNVWILLWNRHRHSKGQEGNKLSYPLKLHLNFNDTSQLETLLNERLLTIGTGRKCLTVLCECGPWWPGGEGMGSWCNRCNRPAGDCLGKTGVVNWLKIWVNHATN